MARTVTEIKNEIASRFIANPVVQEAYGFDTGKDFESLFSKVSFESILFFIVASAIWMLEVLFDRHKAEVEELISQLKPHTLQWYAGKARAFQFGDSLPHLKPDTDEYENTGKSDSEIEAEKIVKYAAVVEKSAIVYIKVATGEAGDRHPLAEEQKMALEAYLKEIKDAGVKLQVVNDEPDCFGLHLDVYYDPQIFSRELTRLDNNEKSVHQAVSAFVENLPFNGEYRNSALVNRLSEIEGVVLVELHQATCNGELINAKKVPDSGYFKIANDDALVINPIPYETISI